MRHVYLLGDPEGRSPRIFVELWDTKDWTDVQVRLTQLSGVGDIAFRKDAWGDHLAFRYRDNSFRFYRGCGDYSGVVDDPSCADDILLDVANHLSGLLER